VILNIMLTLMVAAGSAAPQVEINIKDRGTIVVQLRPDEAPITCAHFLSMVKSGYYDGTAFNRVVPDFVIQGGAPSTKGMKEDPSLKLATEKTKRSFLRGSLSYARSFGGGVYGATSPYQFFICTGNAPHLDPDFANFGYVVSGMDVADTVKQGDVITSMKVIRE
jgi:peptidyl-prolyl cis-trans isomerase B (cyclophilin B)